jgi:hypothetical protein
MISQRITGHLSAALLEYLQAVLPSRSSKDRLGSAVVVPARSCEEHDRRGRRNHAYCPRGLRYHLVAIKPPDHAIRIISRFEAAPGARFKDRQRQAGKKNYSLFRFLLSSATPASMMISPFAQYIVDGASIQNHSLESKRGTLKCANFNDRSRPGREPSQEDRVFPALQGA